MPHPQVVQIATTADDMSEVYRFRYEIYVHQMALPLKSETKELRDTHDAYSTLFLLRQQGRTVGTVRGTTLRNGALEIESQCPQWAHLIAETAALDTPNLAEINRLMVRQSHRSQKSLVQLLTAVFTEGIQQHVDLVFFAGKLGPLSRLYRILGGEVAAGEPQPYRVNGHKLGDYVLMKFDMRKRNSLLARALSRSARAALQTS